MENLRKKAISGIGWVSIISFFNRMAHLLVTLILAKLLAPYEFGIIAMGLLVVNILTLFREVGVGAALIHNQENPEKAASTTFYLIIAVSTILFLITCLVSGPISIYFNRQISQKIICFFSFSIVISALGKTHFLMLQKYLRFKLGIFPEIVSAVGYSVTTLVLAWMNYGVWSLVYGILVSEMLRTITLIIITPWQPCLEFDISLAKDLLKFGKHVLGSTFLAYIFANIDQIIIGRFIGAMPLGFYSFSHRIANLPAQNISQIVGQVMFPVYSQIQEQQQRLQNIYLNTFKYVSLLVIPLAFAIFFLVPELFRLLYGNKWDSAIPVLKILAFYGLFRSLASLTGSIFTGTGIPQWIWYIYVIQIVMVLPFFYPAAYYYGIDGIAILFTSSFFIGTIISLWKTACRLHISLWQYPRKLILPVVASTISFLLGRIILGLAGNTMLLFIAQCAVIGLLYLFVIYIMDRALFYSILGEVKNVIYKRS